MNYWILLLFSGAFVASTGLIYFLRGFAIKHGLFDEPGNNKIHTKAIPYLGGIGIWGAAAIALIAGVGFHLIPAPWVAGFILGGTVILLLGLWDDLKWKQSGRTFLKLVFQCLISLTTILFFIKLGINFQMVISPWLMIPFVTLYLVAVINALNVDDGLDGLAAGVSCIILITMFCIAAYQEDYLIMAMSISLAGATVGFLRYNFNPAKIFMGDTGSLFLGFVLAVLSVKGSHKSATIVTMLIPVIAMGLPILDTLLAITRRFSAGENVFRADNEHIHHRLIKIGLSHRKVVLVLYGFSVLLGITAFLLSVIKNQYVAIILTVVIMTFFIVFKYLRPVNAMRKKDNRE